MVTTILAQPTPTTSLTDAVIAFLQTLGEPTPFTLVDAMAAELATMLEQGQHDGDDLEASDFRYALLKVTEEPIPFDLYPTCLWPDMSIHQDDLPVCPLTNRPSPTGEAFPRWHLPVYHS